MLYSNNNIVYLYIYQQHDFISLYDLYIQGVYIIFKPIHLSFFRCIQIQSPMTTRYDLWELDDLRAEADKRAIKYSSKDEVKTLASRLRTYDRIMSREGVGESVGEELEVSKEEKQSGLSFEKQIQILELQRKIRQEKREMIALEREAEREDELERREYERQKAREEEEREVREEERLRALRVDKEKMELRSEDSQ